MDVVLFKIGLVIAAIWLAFLAIASVTAFLTEKSDKSTTVFLVCVFITTVFPVVILLYGLIVFKF